MFDFKKLSEAAMREGMKLMSDPRVMKLMSNPRVMGVMMKAFELRGNVQAAVDQRVKKVARRFKLATRDDLSDLRSALRSLEQTLKQVQSKVEANGAAGTGTHHSKHTG